MEILTVLAAICVIIGYVVLSLFPEINAKPLTDEKIIQEFEKLTKLMGMQKHKLLVYRNTIPGAYSRLRNKILLSSEGIKVWNEKEISAVLIHELAHSKLNIIPMHIIILLYISLLVVPWFIFNFSINIKLFLTLLIRIIGANLICKKLQKYEFETDEYAKNLKYGNHLISALNKRSEELKTLSNYQRLFSLPPKIIEILILRPFRTHPSDEERIKKLQ